MFDINYHDIVILRADPTHITPPDLHGLHTIELGHDRAADILDSYISLGHKSTLDRISKRLTNRLRFIQLFKNNQLLGFTWIVCNAYRYIDESAYNFAVGETEFWVRDVFISPGARGQRLFGKLMYLITLNHVQNCTSIFSDVDRDNVQSIRAHHAFGFSNHLRIRSLNFRRKLLFRTPAPNWIPAIQSIKPSQSLLYFDDDTLRLHQSMIA